MKTTTEERRKQRINPVDGVVSSKGRICTFLYSILLASICLVRPASSQYFTGMAIDLYAERYPFGPRLVINDGGRNDLDGVENDTITIDVDWGQYRVTGSLERRPASAFAMAFTSATITRILPGSDPILIILNAGQFTPSGSPLIIASANVDGTGTGTSTMNIGASAQLFSPSGDKYTPLAYTAKHSSVGLSPWSFSATTGFDFYSGPLNYVLAFLNIEIEGIGDSMFLPTSFEVIARTPDDKGPAFERTPGPMRRWPVNLGGNGHRYQAFEVIDGITWTEAEEVAWGLGGYLATITSDAENQFVFGLIDKSQYWTPLYEGSCCSWGPWIGGFQEPGAWEPDGGWQWVTGEPFDYTAWRSAEPNNDVDKEHHLHFFAIPNDARKPTWNDFDGLYPLHSFVVEYEDTMPIEIIPGDVDQNGRVDEGDLSAFERFSKNPIEAKPVQILAGDLDGDGSLTQRDKDLLLVMVGPVPPTCQNVDSKVVFDNTNGFGVQNAPPNQTIVSLSQPVYILSIMTYHWNNGIGATPGTLSLQNTASGQTYGPWQAVGTGSPVQNADWTVYPCTQVPAGTYRVIDSCHATWSHNLTSGQKGFTRVIVAD